MGVFKEVREEILLATDELIPTEGNSTCQSLGRRGYLSQWVEWITVPIQETIQSVVFRTMNRVMVGVPLCP